jgi:hypothetical protein
VIGSTGNLASRHREHGAARPDIADAVHADRCWVPEFEVRKKKAWAHRRPKGMSAEIEMFELVGLNARA